MKKDQTTLRNRHIVALMRQIVKEHRAIGQQLTFNEVVDAVMAARPPAHYVDYDYASRMLHGLRANSPDVLGRRRTLCRWLDLDRQVSEVMERKGLTNVNSALSYVLNFCRPKSFYVSRRVVAGLARKALPENQAV